MYRCMQKSMNTENVQLFIYPQITYALHVIHGLLIYDIYRI